MHLSDCFMDLFAYVRHLLGSVALRQPPFEEVRKTVTRLVEKGDAAALQAGLPRDEYDLARFAVCAWVDEALARSAWENKQLWLKEQLQRLYYGTAAAGEEFFARLEGLGLHQREVREVYYLCLALGFSGRYCKPGDEPQLEQLKVANLKLLLGSSLGLPALDRGELFPEAYPASDTSATQPPRWRQGFSLPGALCLAAPLCAFLFLFVLYRFILGNVGDNFLKAVAK